MPPRSPARIDPSPLVTRRRAAFHAAGVYAVVAWFLVQLLAASAGALALPEWSVRFAVGLSFVGLPVALGLAWMFARTSRHTPAPPTSGHPQRTGQQSGRRVARLRPPRLETVLLATLALLGVGLWAYRTRRSDVPVASAVSATSVAVLPFENVTGDPEQDFFSQGISDEIRASLSRVPGLEVASRTSSFHHASRGETVQEIGGALAVASILEGTVERASDRVRIRVSLVDTHTDRQLWTETFDRQLDVETLFAVEAEVAEAVARALQLELAPGGGRLSGAVPASMAAHDLYLLGLFYWNRRTGEDLLRAADFFEQAAGRDPTYALAYAGVANTHVLLPLYARVPADEAMPRALAAAETALALDSTLAEAHAAVALVRATFEWDWAAAEAGFRRSLSLNPRYATAHEWYGVLLDALGRREEARAELERALSLDPMLAILNEVFGNHLLFAGDYDAAIAQLRRTLELQPDFPLALQFLAEAYLLAGRREDGLRTLRRLAEVTDAPREAWARVLAGMDSPTQRADALRALEELGRAGALGPYNRAQYAALLGAEQEALAALEEGLVVRDFLMFLVSADPAFDDLADEPRFVAILARMGLQP